MYDIISVGAATLDIFVKSDQFILQPNTASPQFLSLPYSSKNEISQGLICSGGGATNSAVSFSRLGLKTACVGLVGNDHLSPIITQELKNENVTSLITASPKSSTDYSIILVAPDGARSILTNRGDSCLSAKNINWDELSQTKWIYITSIEGNLDLIEQLIGYAKENNIKVALNPGNRELSQRKSLLPFLKYVDFLLLNTYESETLLQKPFNDQEFLDELISLGPQVVAVTNGRNGAYIVTPKERFYSPIINIRPVDETGAGDSFGSAFVAGLLHHKDVSNSLSWAIHNSASVVSYLGAKRGLLTLEEINR